MPPRHSRAKAKAPRSRDGSLPTSVSSSRRRSPNNRINTQIPKHKSYARPHGDSESRGGKGLRAQPYVKLARIPWRQGAACLCQPSLKAEAMLRMEAKETWLGGKSHAPDGSGANETPPTMNLPEARVAYLILRQLDSEARCHAPNPAEEGSAG
ncbi:hypothetical protein MRB53_025484 [Persea americana]|uniref:Uncharacterized protein n=1 Tax=Persea americana TaxID=3435 RepID=A0ACC2LG17_PERAE|nr:hypothetical protein MRB53_025484 [Persea americana]